MTVQTNFVITCKHVEKASTLKTIWKWILSCDASKDAENELLKKGWQEITKFETNFVWASAF